MLIPLSGPGLQPVERKGPDLEALRAKAEQLESAFLAEMLGYAGLGAARDSFGGGIGEEQFASFLRQEQASAIVAKGGIGLAEQLFHALTKGHADAG